MAARIVHHAAAERLLKCVEFKNPDRFRFGIIMPDSAGWSSEESKKAHFLKLICSGTKKTYDLTAFRVGLVAPDLQQQVFFGNDQLPVQHQELHDVKFLPA